MVYPYKTHVCTHPDHRVGPPVTPVDVIPKHRDGKWVGEEVVSQDDCTEVSTIKVNRMYRIRPEV